MLDTRYISTALEHMTIKDKGYDDFIPYVAECIDELYLTFLNESLKEQSKVPEAKSPWGTRPKDEECLFEL